MSGQRREWPSDRAQLILPDEIETFTIRRAIENAAGDILRVMKELSCTMGNWEPDVSEPLSYEWEWGRVSPSGSVEIVDDKHRHLQSSRK
jgi:hypothetical protein